MPRATESLVPGLGSAYGCFFKVQAMWVLWQPCNSHVCSAPITGLQGHPAGQGHAGLLGSDQPPRSLLWGWVCGLPTQVQASPQA